jgi:hypothetical protein
MVKPAKRWPRSNLRRRPLTLGASILLALVSACSIDADSQAPKTPATPPEQMALVEHPSSTAATTSTTIAPSIDDEAASAQCGAAGLGAQPGEPGYVIAVCEQGWAIGSITDVSGSLTTTLFKQGEGTWSPVANTSVASDFAVDELVHYGMEPGLAERFGSPRPWITAENLPALISLLGTVSEIHEAIADPCSLLTILQLDLADQSFVAVTNDSDQCVLASRRSLIKVDQGVTTLQVSMPAGEVGGDPVLENLFARAAQEYGDIASIDLLICGDPLGGEICVSEFRTTPPERRS